MATKKNFAKSASAIDKFFTPIQTLSEDKTVIDDNQVQDNKYTNVSNDTTNTIITKDNDFTNDNNVLHDEKYTKYNKHTNVLNDYTSTKILKDTKNTKPAKNNELTNDSNDLHDEKYIKDNKHTNVLNDTINNNDSYINKDIKYTNVSKHYKERGKRNERYGLLLDKKLKEDLRLLSSATGSKSVNDLIVSVLINYVEQPDNQKRLEQYKKLLQG